MEKQIAKLMKSLDITREEAIELIQEDKEVDRMTSAKQWESDLTTEQKKNSKQARQSGKTTIGQKIHREPKVDNDKREIVGMIINALQQDNQTGEIDIENPQRILNFEFKGRTFRIVLSEPRKTKAGKE